jgi:hypothetical protein
LHAQLRDIHENNAIIKEVKFTTSLINPQFDFKYLDQAFRDVCGRAPIQHICGAGAIDIRPRHAPGCAAGCV